MIDKPNTVTSHHQHAFQNKASHISDIDIFLKEQHTYGVNRHFRYQEPEDHIECDFDHAHL